MKAENVPVPMDDDDKDLEEEARPGPRRSDSFTDEAKRGQLRQSLVRGSVLTRARNSLRSYMRVQQTKPEVGAYER